MSAPSSTNRRSPPCAHSSELSPAVAAAHNYTRSSRTNCAIPERVVLASLEFGTPAAIRVRVDSEQVLFTDRIQGTYRQNVADAVGDFILKRRDQIYAYVLAVTVDDAAQGVTHIVRGADLLDNTPRQIYLQRLLGLAQPSYAHVPVLTEADGGKLAKSRRSVRLSADAPAAAAVLGLFAVGIGAPAIAWLCHDRRRVGLGDCPMEPQQGPKTSLFARKRLISLRKNAGLP